MNRFGPLADGEHDLGLSDTGEQHITVSGTGSLQLGFRDSTGTFQAYTDPDTLLTADASVIVGCGYGTRLLGVVTGAGADFIANVARMRT